MRKVKLLTVVSLMVVFGAGVFYACQKDNEEKSKNTLKKELIVLNNDIYSQMKTSESKQIIQSSWDKFWHEAGNFCQVLGADITGAAVGAGAVQVVAGAAGTVTAGTGYLVVVGIEER